MPGGRPRQPSELKKLKGTANSTREKRNSEKYAEEKIKITDIILTEAKLTVPAAIKDEYCKKYYKSLTKGLISIGVLSGADLPQIEQLCVILQKLREVQKLFVKTNPISEEYDSIERRYLALVSKFDYLAQKYYVSPVARSKIRLDELNIREKELTVKEKETNAVNNLLLARKS